MKVTLVKKRLLSGDFCEKCRQVEELLVKRGYRDRIDEIVIAEEGDDDSPGFRLAAEHGVEVAPFFIVRDDDGAERVYTRALEMFKKEFERRKESVSGERREISADTLARQLQDAPAEKIIDTALKTFGNSCAIAFSGAEDVVLIDMASKTGLPFSVFCLDTGRLYSSTYKFIEKVRNHYGIEVRIVSPDRQELEPFVAEKGLFSFYRDGHGECCGIRKVEPLRRTLADYHAWMTGQRKDQSPSTRGDIPVVQQDPVFNGITGAKLVKFNPLADWTLNQVWEYIKENGVPYNELHDRGFISIGCEPCTRAIRPGEHERAGRWWWEEETQRECGLHLKK